MSDTLASFGVILSGAGIWYFGWIWLDPAVSMVVSVLVLLSAWHLVSEALDVLMETAPSHLDPQEIRDALLAVAGVSSVHCLHVWTIGSSEVSLSSHLVTEPAHEPERLLQEVRSELAERFSIEHTTIQIEPVVGGEEAACADACEPNWASGVDRPARLKLLQTAFQATWASPSAFVQPFPKAVSKVLQLGPKNPRLGSASLPSASRLLHPKGLATAPIRSVTRGALYPGSELTLMSLVT